MKWTRASASCVNALSRPACRYSVVNTNTWQTSLSLQSFNLEVPVDDHERIEKVQEYVANYINADWIESLTATSERSRRLSPPSLPLPADRAGAQSRQTCRSAGRRRNRVP